MTGDEVDDKVMIPLATRYLDEPLKLYDVNIKYNR